jgi:hypothetical protein
MIKDYMDFSKNVKKPGNDLSFKEKARIFSHDYLKLCKYLISPEAENYSFTKKLFPN